MIRDAVWKLADIRPDPENPRKHSDAHVEQLRRSIVEFGFTVPIVVDATGKCLAGHGRLRAANLAGLESVPVRVHENLTPEQARAYLIADNALGEGSEWDLEKLGEQVNALKLADFDLSLLAIDPVQLDALTLEPSTGAASSGRAARDDGDEDDPSPLEPSAAAPWVKDGELYALGSHRLFVGDSLVIENRTRLLGAELVDCVITDPPYAIYGSSSGVSSSIADDSMVIPFFEAVLRACADHMREFAHGYLFHDWRSVGALYSVLKRVPALTLKNNLVWDKKGSGLGSNYANTYENVLFFHRLQPKKVMKNAGERSGIRTVNRPNVLRHNRPSGDERLHNAAKPVPMLIDFVEASTEPGQIVWDPCCGSGSTMIACEKAGRACRTGELNPATAQVAIERWQRLTGKRAEVVE